MYVYGACFFYVCCSDSVGVCGNICCIAVVVKESVQPCSVKYVVCLSVSFCLPHPVAVIAFIICRYCEYVCCMFILRYRLLLYYAGSGVNRVQVVLSGFSVRLFGFVKAKTVCRYGCMYFLAALVLVCVDVMVMSSALV